MIWRCDLVPQYLEYQSEIEDAIGRVLRSGRYILACELDRFERDFASYIGAKHAIGVANGTDALTLALQAAGVLLGDEVITTPFTAIPTVSAIIDAGARPVFVDVVPDTFLMDIEAAAAAVTPRTRAILPVHIFGNVVDVPKLRAFVGKGVTIIEDAAQAHGSSIRGRNCGTMGDMGAFSFYPTKNLGAYGDGGAVVTDNPDYANQIRRRRMYGMVDKDHIDMDGVNSRLDELQAAVLSVKLPHLEAMNERRRFIAARYRRELNPALFAHQLFPTDVVANYHVFVSRFRGDRDHFMRYLEERGIQSNIYYPMPMYDQLPIRRFRPAGGLPEVERLCREVIALPMYPEMDGQILDEIITAVNAYEGPSD
jgi:aminotransferase EvaB